MSQSFLQCAEESCHSRRESTEGGHRCHACGGPLQVIYDFDRVQPGSLRRTWEQRKLDPQPAARSGVWRFRELLPFFKTGSSIISLGEGYTPLVEAPRVGEWAGGVSVAVKHQGMNPTGSFKDLGMTVCITQAAAQNVRVVACASTGNTSSSMAAYAARAGMKAVLFVPAGAVSAAKLAQAMDFGAGVIEVGDTFDQAFQLLNAIASEFGLYLVNSTNPFRIEGQKTIVPELLEQRGWSPPDFIVVPGGNLGNASAIGKGLRELHSLGLLEKIPRVVVVQAEGANPFYRMLSDGSRDLIPVADPRTEATAIRIGNPANWKKALHVLQWTDGLCESVSDQEISEAKAILAKDGVGCEPASAATAAGVRKLCRAGKIPKGADVVAILTGNQLKDTDYILKQRSQNSSQMIDLSWRERAEPTLSDLRRVLSAHSLV
jgi:threonine synthase